MLNPVNRIKFFILCILLSIFFILDIFTGSTKINLSELIDFFSINHDSFTANIFFHFRLPKALGAILVGAALGLSGLLSQTFFRNPLAGPDVLGITSGASLGVSVYLLLFSQYFPNAQISQLGFTAIIISACLGSLLILIILIVLTSYIRDNLVFLILGLMLSAAISSLITIIQYFSDAPALKGYIVWGFGSIRHLNYYHLIYIIPFIILGSVIAITRIKSLNTLLLGEKYAQTMGTNVLSTRWFIFTAIILLSGSVTAFCGPIVFVAITVPHISRMVFQTNNHAVIVPASMILGSLMLILSDIISHIPSNNLVLPINAITSLLGIPLILWILLRKKIM